MYQKIYDDIFEYIDSLEIVDTHEHLPCCEEARDRPVDVFGEYLRHYFSSDLVSAGLPWQDLKCLREPGMEIEEKWKLVEPYWENARKTGYGRALDKTVRGLYGIDGINGSTIGELNKTFMDTFNGGHFEFVLKQKCKIRTALAICRDDREWDRRYYTPVINFMRFILPSEFELFRKLSKDTGLSISSFDDWCDAIKKYVNDRIDEGYHIWKSNLAYRMSIRMDIVDRADAEREFNGFFRQYLNHLDHDTFITPTSIVGLFNTLPAYKSYIFHLILKILDDRGCILQIHTGLQEGNGNYIENSNPTLLANLFALYRQITFDIFHISYPYEKELTVLAKMFPNVNIDMCWAQIISPNASVNALLEWFDTVPLNKISAFGGDYSLIDGVYGHQLMAKENVSRALALSVENGTFDINEAKHTGKMMFFDNPMRIFRLK